MSFSAQWLSLREPHDRAARNASVLDALASYFGGRASLGVVDLACGTGSTLRAVSSLLPARQDWRLADNNLGLLAHAAKETAAPGLNVTTMAVDLVRDLELALDGALDLVTMSALLDLVSADWIERLAVEAAARRLPVYAALSYDGRVALDPADPTDKAIVAAVNAHQHGNKGFGRALGPDAASVAIACFEDVGYEIVHGRSDWLFRPEDAEIQNEVIAGWAAAAREISQRAEGLGIADIANWLDRRRSLIAEGRSTIRVGHVDFFARPTGMR